MDGSEGARIASGGGLTGDAGGSTGGGGGVFPMESACEVIIFWLDVGGALGFSGAATGAGAGAGVETGAAWLAPASGRGWVEPPLGPTFFTRRENFS